MSIKAVIMSEEQIREFLEKPRFAIVGTNRAKGPPQQSPVWYLYEDGQIYINIYTRSAKYKNLSRDPAISICVAGDPPDSRAVIMTGEAEIVQRANTPAYDDLSWRLVRRYYDSDDEAHSYNESAGNGADSALIMLKPERVLAQDYN
ncbi:MAG: TIGR03618 family F420-dependent PPOX class oxidoreductase [Gammaproteobacteria bacterium]|nr:TIGR03618 family F420-dependent PPOX class oxidoreductase [Gammaproteobacteria bacterium]